MPIKIDDSPATYTWSCQGAVTRIAQPICLICPLSLVIIRGTCVEAYFFISHILLPQFVL